MRLTVLLLGVAVAMPVAAAEVYRTTDAAGNVIFSDQPSPGAEKVQIQETATIPGDDAPRFEYTPPAEAFAYRKVTIESPADDEALRPEDASVNVSVAVEPQLRSQDSLVLMLDGREFAAGTSQSFALADLDRGTHTVQALVREQGGKILARSSTVSFHVLRTAIPPKKAAPANPPKPPKPAPAKAP